MQKKKIIQCKENIIKSYKERSEKIIDSDKRLAYRVNKLWIKIQERK